MMHLPCCWAGHRLHNGCFVDAVSVCWHWQVAVMLHKCSCWRLQAPQEAALPETAVLEAVMGLLSPVSMPSPGNCGSCMQAATTTALYLVAYARLGSNLTLTFKSLTAVPGHGPVLLYSIYAVAVLVT